MQDVLCGNDAEGALLLSVLCAERERAVGLPDWFRLQRMERPKSARGSIGIAANLGKAVAGEGRAADHGGPERERRHFWVRLGRQQIVEVAIDGFLFSLVDASH